MLGFLAALLAEAAALAIFAIMNQVAGIRWQLAVVVPMLVVGAAFYWGSIAARLRVLAAGAAVPLFAFVVGWQWLNWALMYPTGPPGPFSAYLRQAGWWVVLIAILPAAFSAVAAACGYLVARRLGSVRTKPER